jgi:hypothetical protein
MSKYVFKLIGNTDHLLIVIQSGEYSFENTIKPALFSDLEYINNDTLLPFISKVIDKYTDEQMKLDYNIEQLDSGSIKLVITVNDGKTRNYEVILKSKELHDKDEKEHIQKHIDDRFLESRKYTDEKTQNLELMVDHNISSVHRKYDRLFDNLDKKFNSELVHTSYHKWKTRSIKIIKCINKRILKTNFYEYGTDTTNQMCKELEKIIILSTKYQDFIRSLVLDSHISYRSAIVKEFIDHISIEDLLEILINTHKQIEVLYFDVVFDPIHQRYTVYFKFMYDDIGPDFNYKVCKDITSIANGEIPFKLIYNPYINGLPKTGKEYLFICELRNHEFQTPRISDTESDKFSLNSDLTKSITFIKDK